MCCGPVRACVGVCVGHVCDWVDVVGCACMLVCVCLCVVGVTGWCVGVRVRVHCDGVGLVAVAWTRVCMCVCRGCGVCWCVAVFLFVCVGVWCVLRCCVDDVGGGGLCGCTCIVWADGGD